MSSSSLLSVVSSSLLNNASQLTNGAPPPSLPAAANAVEDAAAAAGAVERATAAAATSFQSPHVQKLGLYDDHTQPHATLTHAQLTFFLSCALAFIWWLLRLSRRGGGGARHTNANFASENGGNVNGGEKENLKGNAATTSSVVVEGEKGHRSDSEAKPRGGAGSDVSGSCGNGVIKGDVKAAATSSGGGGGGGTSSVLPPVPSLDEVLKGVGQLGLVMLFFLLCDYIKVFPEEERTYSRDIFLFLVFLLFLVAFAFTLTPTKDKILSRDQTEEWKGWMQVMFVWYHYFAAMEWYNWVRVYIACYVWMTGFGNFSFFWVRGDYSLWRVVKMLFRINFLVVVIVVVTDNEYMLYYICAMHTYWFLTVYAFMRTLTSWNTHRYKMAAKFAAYILANALIFEIPGNCSTVFRPLWFIFGFHDDVHDNIMHEWEFRAGLDHWACLFGMLCAYNYPHFEAFMQYLEAPAESGREALRKLGVKLGMVLGCALVGVGWYFGFMRKNKYDYNTTHCYSSLIGILMFLVLRNSFPILRRYYLGLFAFLGKITLETYLSQLHVYLQSNAKHRLGYLPSYPLLTLALSTILYLGISHMLFNLTQTFSAFFVQKDWRKAARMSAIAGVVVAGCGLASVGLLVGSGGSVW